MTLFAKELLKISEHCRTNARKHSLKLRKYDISRLWPHFLRTIVRNRWPWAELYANSMFRRLRQGWIVSFTCILQNTPIAKSAHCFLSDHFTLTTHFYSILHWTTFLLHPKLLNGGLFKTLIPPYKISYNILVMSSPPNFTQHVPNNLWKITSNLTQFLSLTPLCASSLQCSSCLTCNILPQVSAPFVTTLSSPFLSRTQSHIFDVLSSRDASPNLIPILLSGSTYSFEKSYKNSWKNPQP